MMRKQTPYLQAHGIDAPHERVVIRRRGAIAAMREQLTDRHGRPKFKTPEQAGRVIYSSPTVDVAANMELVRETVEACRVILELTTWDIRLLSKSNLLPKVAELLEDRPDARERMIYGVSTGTLDDRVAAVFEGGTARVSKRLESLHRLQDEGFRTFGMICPNLPQRDYFRFAAEMREAIRAAKCEHVWAEVLNARGASMTRTVAALRAAGYVWEADQLVFVSHDKAAWESYARQTFLAHVAEVARPGKLRFLQYVTADSRAWWKSREPDGAILL